MAGIVQSLFGGGGGQSTPWYVANAQPNPGAAPAAPDEAATLDAERKERMQQAQAAGRSASILTDFALATRAPSVLKASLGGA